MIVRINNLVIMILNKLKCNYIRYNICDYILFIYIVIHIRAKKHT